MVSVHAQELYLWQKVFELSEKNYIDNLPYLFCFVCLLVQLPGANQKSSGMYLILFSSYVGTAVSFLFFS